MSSEIKLRYPTSRLAEYVDLMAEKEGVPVKLIPVDEYRFIFTILYEDLKNFIVSLLSRKYDNLKVITDKNKIIFYFRYEDKYLLIEDLHQVVERIWERFHVKIGLDLPSEKELVIIMKAEPLATKIAQKMLELLKRKNNNIIRLFKFKKGEMEIPKYGYGVLVLVEYVNATIEQLEDVVNRL